MDGRKKTVVGDGLVADCWGQAGREYGLCLDIRPTGRGEYTIPVPADRRVETLARRLLAVFRGE